MKWDYFSAVRRGLDSLGPDGEDRFEKTVAELAQRLGGDIEIGEALNGYSQGFHIVRDGEVLLRCLTRGAGSAADTSQFLAASTASEVYPIFQELYPKHSVSRLDACEDYSGAGTWDKLEALVTEVCSLHKVTMAPFGEGHVRPDGTRDATKGRSWYCGSKNSPFRIVIYEKGLEQIAKGIPDEPTRVRLEVRIRPSSKSKEFVGSSGLMPIDLFGMSRWGLEVAKRLGVAELKRMAIGSVWRPTECEEVAQKIVKMFDRGMDRLLEQYGSPEEVGRILYEIQQKSRTAKQLKNSMQVETHGERAGVSGN